MCTASHESLNKILFLKKKLCSFLWKNRVSAKISVTRRRVQIGAQMKKKCPKMSQKRAIMSTNIVVLDQET